MRPQCNLTNEPGMSFRISKKTEMRSLFPFQGHGAQYRRLFVHVGPQEPGGVSDFSLQKWQPHFQFLLGWIPACAGMTAPRSATVWQMTPLPGFEPMEF